MQADGRVLSMHIEPVVNRTNGNVQPSWSNGATSWGNTSSNFQTPQASYNSVREQAEQERRRHVANANFQDGRFGFRSDYNPVYNRRGNRNTQGTGLYSDQMMRGAPSQPTLWTKRGQ